MYVRLAAAAKISYALRANLRANIYLIMNISRRVLLGGVTAGLARRAHGYCGLGGLGRETINLSGRLTRYTLYTIHYPLSTPTTYVRRDCDLHSADPARPFDA